MKIKFLMGICFAVSLNSANAFSTWDDWSKSNPKNVYKYVGDYLNTEVSKPDVTEADKKGMLLEGFKLYMDALKVSKTAIYHYKPMNQLIKAHREKRRQILYAADAEAKKPYNGKGYFTVPEQKVLEFFGKVGHIWGDDKTILQKETKEWQQRLNEKLKGAFSKDPFIAILKKFNKGYYPEPWDRILFKIQEYAAENHLTVGFNTAQARHLGILLEALSSYRFMDLQKDKPIRIHLSDFNEVMDQDLYTDENRRKSPESQNILHEYKEYFLENTKRECNVNPEVAIIESVGAKALANYMGMIEKVDVLNNVIKEGRQALQPIQATEEGAKLSGDLNELRTFHDSLLSINELDDFLNNGKVLQEKIAKAVKEAPRS